MKEFLSRTHIFVEIQARMLQPGGIVNCKICKNAFVFFFAIDDDLCVKIVLLVFNLLCVLLRNTSVVHHDVCTYEPLPDYYLRLVILLTRRCAVLFAAVPEGVGNRQRRMGLCGPVSLCDSCVQGGPHLRPVCAGFLPWQGEDERVHDGGGGDELWEKVLIEKHWEWLGTACYFQGPRMDYELYTVLFLICGSTCP